MNKATLEEIWNKGIYNFLDENNTEYHIINRREFLYSPSKVEKEYECVKVKNNGQLFSLVHLFKKDDIVYYKE